MADKSTGVHVVIEETSEQAEARRTRDALWLCALAASAWFCAALAAVLR